MLVGEIMTRPVVTVRDDASPQSAVELLADLRLTMLPVLDAGGRLVGVVSEADLLVLPEPLDPRAHLRAVPSARETPGEDGPLTVAALMSSPPHTTYEQADVAEVAAVFRRTAWKGLPVMRDVELVGVISRSDIIRAMARDDDDVERDVDRLLLDGLGPRWHARVVTGAVTIVGTGPDREADAAASLAATVQGVRSIRVQGGGDGAAGASGSVLTATRGQTWSCPPSSGTAVDQL